MSEHQQRYIMMKWSLLVTYTIVEYEISMQMANNCFLGVIFGFWATFSIHFSWYSPTLLIADNRKLLIFNDRKTNTKFIIIINGVIPELRLPKDGLELRHWWHVKFGIFRPTSKAHFRSFFADIPNTLNISTDAFTLEEYKIANASIKEGKACGDDKVAPEVLQRCDLDQIILDLGNKALTKGEKPDQWPLVHLEHHTPTQKGRPKWPKELQKNKLFFRGC